jgi:leucyl-tRNA synthetase
MAKAKSTKYLPSTIEKKWQEEWQKAGLYSFNEKSGGDPYYTLVELPYPSGDLHIGHWFTFTTADSHARFQRMRGRNVFFPNGFDAFGLPAENAAIKRQIHPKDWTMKNIETMKGQFATMGSMIDWDHTAITCQPQYYRWNQWIFTKLYEKGLAYRGKTYSNWCPVDQTVLANEAIENGKCWRCGSIVEQKPIEQWFLKITEYADRLLWENTDQKIANGVDWPRSVREGQNNWIGRSEGALIKFPLNVGEATIDVFTTRPDTLFGATVLVLAPEHPLLPSIIRDKESSSVQAYLDTAKRKTELERKEMKDKTGVFTGSYAKHPLTGEDVPVWVADYVLIGYGTGAIMAVPAHDERDYEFAKKFAIPIRQVIQSEKEPVTDETAFTGEGVLINSGEFDGLASTEAKKQIIASLEKKGLGERRINYHLHDWSISRQRYWGTPVPMIHCADCGIVPVPEKDLPVELPYEVDYTPKGEPPLATAKEWVNVPCPKCGKAARRDTETLDTFFDSSWYFYRYISPAYENGPFDEALAEKLLPVDIYFGGAEHTLGHTLYARFFTKFFKDLGLIPFDEFAAKRIQHGVILGPDGFRMSKSRGNVVNPDDVVREYGADTVRLYLGFMMPFEATAPWNGAAISGIYRFLKRVWQLQDVVADRSLDREDVVRMSQTIKKVGEDLEVVHLNTSIAALMEWLNHLARKDDVSREEYKTLLLLLSPMAPHMTEELWHKLGEKGFIHEQAWPSYDEADTVEDVVTLVVQVNGKVRANMEMSRAKSAVQKEVEAEAVNNERVKPYLVDKSMKKVIFVPGKLINFVIA